MNSVTVVNNLICHGKPVVIDHWVRESEKYAAGDEFEHCGSGEFIYSCELCGRSGRIEEFAPRHPLLERILARGRVVLAEEQLRNASLLGASLAECQQYHRARRRW